MELSSCNNIHTYRATQEGTILNTGPKYGHIRHLYKTHDNCPGDMFASRYAQRATISVINDNDLNSPSLCQKRS